MENNMKYRWLTGAAAVALTVAGAVAAQAADLPTRKEAPAPAVYVPPPFTWTGFYLGLNAGGIWGTGNKQATLYNPYGVALLNNISYGGLGGNNLSGFIGGGQAGYNYQSGAAVFGVEADFDWTGLSKSRNVVGANFFDFNGNTDWFSAHSHASMDWLGTLRGRVGFVATPDNRLMFYGTGGLAYGGGSGNISVYDANNGWAWAGSKSDTRWGWTIGLGTEYAITNNITIKGEYLYYNLGTTNEVAVPNVLTANVFPNTTLAGKVTYEGSIFRVGANYKF
jgi:outer membrane immunogenic protein